MKFTSATLLHCDITSISISPEFSLLCPDVLLLGLFVLIILSYDSYHEIMLSGHNNNSNK